MLALRSNIKYILRGLFRTPLFTFSAIAVLSLSLGASAAVFTIINSLYLRPMPYYKPEQIYHVAASLGLRYQNYKDLLKQNVFADLALWRNGAFYIAGTSEPERLVGKYVTSNYLSLLGVRPLLGRTFLSYDDEEGTPCSTVLGYSFWKTHFAQRQSIIGDAIRLNGGSCTVIGVMPKNFPARGGVDVWVPLHFLAQTSIASVVGSYPGLVQERVYAFARVKDGISVHAAVAHFGRYVRALYNEGVRYQFWADPINKTGRTFPEDVPEILQLFLIAVALVLILACSNLSSLLLARGSARQKETAIHLAMGADRLTIFWLHLLEAGMLFLPAVLLALLLCNAALRIFVAYFPSNVPYITEVSIDKTVVAFVVLVAASCAILTVLFPALRFSRINLQPALKQGGTKSVADLTGIRFQKVLVSIQVAVSVTLLGTTILIFQSLLAVSKVNPGFETRNLAILDIQLPPYKYLEAAQWNRFYEELFRRLQSLPFVDQVSGTSSVPLSGTSQHAYIQKAQGLDHVPGDELYLFQVTSGYFRSMDIRMTSGNTFSTDWRKSAYPELIVNRSLADLFWPGQNPIGKWIQLEGEEHRRTVIGVVNDVRHSGLGKAPEREMYIPLQDDPWLWLSIVVRPKPQQRISAEALRQTVWSLDKDQPAVLSNMEDLVKQDLADHRFFTASLNFFAMFAILFSCVGIYGLLAYSVSQRTLEIGIRKSLGARDTDIFRLFMLRVSSLVVIGMIAGLFMYFVTSRLLVGFLYGVKPGDPATLVLVCGLILVLCLAAAFFPSRRAARLDPLLALRFEYLRLVEARAKPRESGLILP